MLSRFTTLGFAALSIAAIFSLLPSPVLARGDGPAPPAAPIFSTDTPCGANISVQAGGTVSFLVCAKDPAGIQPILLLWNNIPGLNATTTPPCPLLGLPGAPICTVFSFNPTAADVAGSPYLVIFTAYLGGTLQGLTAKCHVNITVEPSLSAEILSMSATVAYPATKVVFRWDTGSEVDNAFFNVYRSESNNFEDAIQVNNAPVMAQGGPSFGASYTLPDRSSQSGHHYNYWLESVDIFGETQLFGPVPVVVRAQ